MVSSPRPGWLALPCPILPPWGAGVEEVSSYGCSGTQLARGEASGEAVDEDEEADRCWHVPSLTAVCVPTARGKGA